MFYFDENNNEFLIWILYAIYIHR